MLGTKNNIICLQDVHINAQLEPFIKSEWGYEVLFSSFTNSSRGGGGGHDINE